MSKASTKPRWGDEDDDDDDDEELDVVSPLRVDLSSGGGGTGQIPPTHVSRIDSKGIQIITSYRPNPRNPNGLIKTITKVRVTTEKVREPRGVAIRRKWKKFGQAALETDTSNVTIPSRDDVFLEDPNADTDLQDEDPAKGLAGNLNDFWKKQQRRQLERKYDVNATPGDEADASNNNTTNNQDASGGAAGGGWTQVTGSAGGGGAAGGGGGKYVPPAQRAGLGRSSAGSGPASGPGGDRNRTDDLNTIRVTNISENTTEADLQELFQRFGRISRVYLAKDKETMVSRGFAFVSFVHKEEAAVAMEKLQGFGYDHLILKLEWARPSAKDPAMSSGNEYRSGYGKALAQDTKEKVSFASNLTR